MSDNTLDPMDGFDLDGDELVASRNDTPTAAAPAASGEPDVAAIVDKYERGIFLDTGEHVIMVTPEDCAAAIREALRTARAQADAKWITRIGEFRQALNAEGLHGHYNLFQQFFGDAIEQADAGKG